MSSERPLVSIITRTKDRPQLLINAIQSIAEQTYWPIEVVLVNDGGCDLNIEEIKGVLGDISLNYLRLEKNTGRAHAGNMGIENAKGEYIGFLDDDDIFTPDHVAKLIDAVKKNEEILVAYSGVRVVDAENATIKIYDEPFDLTRLRGANFLPIHAILFSRTLVQAGCRFDESLECLEDWDFWLQVAERTHFLHVPGVSAIYRYDLGESALTKKAQFETHLANRALLFSKWNQRYSPREWVETLYWFELRDGQIIGLQAERAAFETKLAELQAERAAFETKLAELQAERAAFETKLAELQAERAAFEVKLAESEAEAHRFRELANDILSSKSWKLTAPLRWVRRFISSVFNPDRFVSGLASLQDAIAKTYWYYRKSGLKATVRKDRDATRYSKSMGFSLGLPELLDIMEVQPLSGGNPGRIAIHAHVYYPDLTRELASYLKNMPFIFDLFVSVPTDEARDTCYQVFSKLPRVSRVKVDIVENRGRDIAPMVCHFGAQLAQYDYFCHIHTKKSIYTQGKMVGWREYLFRQLLGSENQVGRIFSLLVKTPDTGIIYPQNYEHLPYWGNTWLSNRALGSRMCFQMGIKDMPEGYFDYPAGSMFWARSKAIQNLFSAGIILADFSPEAGQTDGTLSHCVERLLPLVAKQAGYTTLILRDPFYPSWSKWRFDRYMDRTHDYVYKMMREANDLKVVAFDIFDTLLVRPVLHPETTKNIIEHRLQENGGAGFAGLRAHAEELARSRLGRDVGLEDIYSEFASLTGKQVNEVKHLRALEEHIELHMVAPRPECVELFNHAMRSGKRVVLVSDMFLPQSVVVRMLAENGIAGYQTLYLSSDIGVRKDTGELYRLLLEQEKIAPGELLMVGDNEHSDVQIPVDLGIQVFHVLRPVEIARSSHRFTPLLEWARTEGSLDEQLVLGLVATRLFQSVFYEKFDPDGFIPGGPENIGYAVIGPVVLSFCLWLRDQAKADGIEKLYFLAREGQLLKEVCDRVAKHVEDTIPSEYLVLSRRAVTVAMIESSDDICRIARASAYFPNELKAFIRYRYGVILDDNDVKDLCRRGFWKTGKSVEISGDISHLHPVLEELAEKIFTRSRAERPGLAAYLNSLGLNDSSSAAVVDVGYSGTIQGMLSGFLKKPIHGYYMLTSAKSRKIYEKHGAFAHGYYGSQINGDDSNVSPLWRRSFELEMFLSSNDPQVIYYDLCNDGQLKAVYQELFLNEKEASEIRNKIRFGLSSFIDDFFAIQRNIYPGIKLPSRLPEMLFGEFVDHMSMSERTTISGLALDDHYCGRGIVTLMP